jgi:hypothetical protein
VTLDVPVSRKDKLVRSGVAPNGGEAPPVALSAGQAAYWTLHGKLDMVGADTRVEAGKLR